MQNNKPNILIVDDNPDVLELISGMLDKKLFSTSKAHSGKECLASVNLNKPDVILLDVVMPEMSGLEVCKQIKNDPRLTDICIIMMTGKNNNDDARISGFEAGADDYINRPFTKRELLARLNSGLRFYALEKKNRQLDITYKKLFDLSKDAILTLDPENRIITYNAFAVKLFAFDSKSPTGINLRDFIHPHSLELWDKYFSLLISNITPPLLIIDLIIDEKNVKAEIISSPIFDGIRVTSALCFIRLNMQKSDSSLNVGKSLISESELRETEFLDMLSKPPSQQTAAIYDAKLLSEEYPEIFSRLNEDYFEIVKIMIDNRIYKRQVPLKPKLLDLASKLGYMKATPRDLIIIHKNMLAALTADIPDRKAFLIKEEGRIALLELMGYLASYYRNLN